MKYLGLHLDRRLTWRAYILAKRKQLDIKFRQMQWLIGRKSELSTENKLLVYKTILKPIWTSGIPIWGSASTSNREILQRFQNKVLRAIVNAPWYISNGLLHADLGIPTVREEVTKISWKYKGKITIHTNGLATILYRGTQKTKRAQAK
jgi:hypothetical protein